MSIDPVRAARGRDRLTDEVDVARAVRVVTLRAGQRRAAGRVGLRGRMTGLARLDGTMARSRGRTDARRDTSRTSGRRGRSASHGAPPRPGGRACSSGRSRRARTPPCDRGTRDSLAEVRVAVAARRIELGLAMTDLAHAAARVGRAREAARRQAALDREAHVVETPSPVHQARAPARGSGCRAGRDS